MAGISRLFALASQNWRSGMSARLPCKPKNFKNPHGGQPLSCKKPFNFIEPSTAPDP